jgi:transcriptional regulator GlxA family with amidase domain
MGAFRSAVRKNGGSQSLSKGKGVSPQTAAGSKSIKPTALITGLQEKRLRKILEVIESEPPRHIQALAAECNLSQSHLQHLFKQHTGLGLGHLLNERKLARAAELLVGSNMSIKEVACAIGYEHTSSFTRAFARRFEMSPSRYREANTERQMLTNNLCG